MELERRKCVPCEGGIPPLNEEEILEYIAAINRGWIVKDDKKIVRDFNFVNYKHTMEFVNKVATIAEIEGHHPIMHIGFGTATVELWTHAIDGLSENDFILAAKIDVVV